MMEITLKNGLCSMSSLVFVFFAVAVIVVAAALSRRRRRRFAAFVYSEVLHHAIKKIMHWLRHDKRRS